MPFGGGFAQTQQSAYPQSNYPTQAGYPNAPHYAGYPAAQPPYSAPSPYPSFNMTSGLPTNNYPTQQSHYPTNTMPAHNYPSSAVQMAACFQAANGKKEKVCGLDFNLTF
jgi:hypothetical protein